MRSRKNVMQGKDAGRMMQLAGMPGREGGVRKGAATSVNDFVSRTIGHRGVAIPREGGICP